MLHAGSKFSWDFRHVPFDVLHQVSVRKAEEDAQRKSVAAFGKATAAIFTLLCYFIGVARGEREINNYRNDKKIIMKIDK